MCDLIITNEEEERHVCANKLCRASWHVCEIQRYPISHAWRISPQR